MSVVSPPGPRHGVEEIAKLPWPEATCEKRLEGETMRLRHPFRTRSTSVGLLAVAAVTAVLIAPLATSSGSASAVKIDGAHSLADKVHVEFKKSKGRTSDVHLLAWNDFHGNLEAGTLNIYG